MLTFLFWNINGKPLEASISRLAVTHSVDVLILAECDIEPARMLAALNVGGRNGGYTFPPSESRRLHVYTRLPSGAVRRLLDGSRFSARRVVLEGSEEMLLVAAHLRSKVYQRTDSQQDACKEFARDVRDLEDRVAHQRTIIVGDLNMDPFEPGLVSATGLHAVSSGQVARQGGRRVDGREYPFFYNPMWGCLGERDGRPPGTYYLRRAEHVCFFWNAVDQVLVRPALADSFVSGSLTVLVSDGRRSLLRRNRSGVEVPHPSDHLPILFGLSLREEDGSDAPN